MAIKGMLRENHWRGDEGEVAHLAALCPACGFEHEFRVDLTGNGIWQRNGGDVWTFDGDWDKPTFHPSMGANLHNYESRHPRCHSYLENGRWRFLSDCSHELAGQTVDMVPPDPGMTWQQRHGWHLIDPEKYPPPERSGG